MGRLGRFALGLGALAVAADQKFALQLLPVGKAEFGEILAHLTEQRYAGQQDLAVATDQPFQRTGAPGQVAILRLRVQFVGKAFAEAGEQIQSGRQAGKTMAMQPGLAEPGSDHHVLAFAAQQLAGQALHGDPVGALEVSLPDAGGQAFVVFAARFAQRVILRLVTDAAATGMRTGDRFQQPGGLKGDVHGWG